MDDLERRWVKAASHRALFGQGEPVRVGRFELGERLGVGAAGVVFAAHDPELLRTVALKVLEAEPGGRGVERMAKEAQALARLAHPNVVTVHEVGRDGGLLFIAMELVDGERLDLWCAHTVEWREKLGVLVEAGAGIAAAHERGLVHRDVKPSNIVVDREGHARVVDFGLARATLATGPYPEGARVAGVSTWTRFAGTPAYAAPEQLEGKVADAHSDQYSFAVTAWESLTGAKPFGGETVGERLAAMRAKDPQRGADVSPNVLFALRRALSYRPDERFPSMRELMAALTEARHPSRRSWPTRRLALVTLGIAGVLIALGIARAIGQQRDIPNDAQKSAAHGLDDPESVLACPPLETESEDMGWLGAAAASAACRRAQWMLGGRAERVLVPGALIERVAEPTNRIDDPWARRETRGSALALARSRARATLDGRVEKRAGRFAVVLRVVQSTGGEASEDARGEAGTLQAAVRIAMQALETRGDIPVARALDADVVKWTGVRSAGAGAELAELDAALQGPPPWTVCRTLETRRLELGYALAGARRECNVDGFDVWPDVALDATSPATLALTAPPHFDHPARYREKHAEVLARASAMARRLGEARATEPSSVGKVRLALSEAHLRQLTGRSEEAAQVLQSLGDLAMHSWEVVRMLEWVSVVRFGQQSRASLAIAWFPEMPNAWSLATGYFPCGAGKEPCAPVRLAFERRAYELGPNPGTGARLAAYLIEHDRPREARALGAELSGMSSEFSSAAAVAMSLADAKEGWIGRGLTRLRKAVRDLARMRLSHGDVSLVIQVARLAEVAGLQAEVGEEIARELVLPEPHRLPGDARADLQVVAACMHAPTKIALACISRIRVLRADESPMEGGLEFFTGAEQFARGERRAAAATWRRLAATAFYGHFLPVEVFDEAGEDEIARTLDETRLGPKQAYGDIHPALVREARRAARRGDHETARRMADRVLKAWGAADVPIPAVAEMRALLARGGR